MGLNKTILASSIAIALGMVSHTARASLTTSAILQFTLGTPQIVGCNYGTTPPCNRASYNTTDIVGSYFGVDVDGYGFEADEKTPIGSFNGIRIGTTQAASGSHSGAINGSESPNIDNPWTYFGNTGMHQTTAPTTIASQSAGTATLNLAWSIIWNTAIIPLPAVGPTTMVCDTSSCSDSSNYTLDGAFHIAGGGFTTVPYTLHLEGTISSVPIPAAAWLFGSGLAGLAGVARRRKAV